MSARTAWIASAVCAATLVGVLVWWTQRGERETAPAARSAPPRDVAAAAAERAAAEVSDIAERQFADAAEPILSASSGLRIRGVVLDVDGTARAEVAIEQLRGKTRRLVARSGEDGTFEAELDVLDGTLTTSGRPWTCVAPCKLTRSRQDELHVLLVARALTLEGRVVDERGRGVASASIGVRVPIEVKAKLPKSFDPVPDGIASTVTDANGEFAVSPVPYVPGARLLASREPLQAVGQPLPATDAPLVIVLRDPVNARYLEGVVVDDLGAPLAEASVVFGGWRTRTERDGAFRFVLDAGGLLNIDARTQLVACLEGYQPRVIEEFGAIVRGQDGNPPPQRLVLLAPDLAIRGRVVGARGEPANYASVAVARDTKLGDPAGECARSTFEVALDDIGAFEIRGLSDREYVLDVRLQQSLLHFQSEPIRAGSRDVVVRVPLDAFVPRVVGRVVALDGSGVPNAEVSIVSGSGSDSHPGSLADQVKWATGRVTCDASGAFEMRDVPRHGSLLVITHASVVTTSFDVEVLDLDNALLLPALRKSFLSIEGLPANAQEITVLVQDESEHEPWIEQIDRRAFVRGVFQARVSDGASEQLALGEGRYKLLCATGASPIEREIELLAGQTFVVTP